MADNLTNELLGALADLLVENRALTSALDVVKEYLPAQAHERLRVHVETIKADPALRAAVADRFAQFRGQQVENILPELLKTFPKIKR